MFKEKRRKTVRADIFAVLGLPQTFEAVIGDLRKIIFRDLSWRRRISCCGLSRGIVIMLLAALRYCICRHLQVISDTDLALDMFLFWKTSIFSTNRFNDDGRNLKPARHGIACYSASQFGSKLILTMTAVVTGSSVRCAAARIRAGPGNDPVKMTVANLMTSLTAGSGHHKNGQHARDRWGVSIQFGSTRCNSSAWLALT